MLDGFTLKIIKYSQKSEYNIAVMASYCPLLISQPIAIADSATLMAANEKNV